MKTPSEVKEAYIAYLKSKTAITSLLTTSDEIRETEWQGTTFVYPNIRVAVDFLPAVNRCLTLPNWKLTYSVSRNPAAKRQT